MIIYFVCTGNTCRSPMAQAIAQQLNTELDLGYELHSRGIAVDEEAGAAFSAVEAAKKHDLDLSAHISRQLSDNDVERADVIYTMTAQQRDILNTWYPKAVDKIKTLAPEDIEDPFMQDDEVYMRTFAELSRAIGKTVCFLP